MNLLHLRELPGVMQLLQLQEEIFMEKKVILQPLQVLQKMLLLQIRFRD